MSTYQHHALNNLYFEYTGPVTLGLGGTGQQNASTPLAGGDVQTQAKITR